jgi:hypothetical protein
MNRIDELLGVATFAAAAMFAAIAIGPVTSVVATAAAPRAEAQVVTADPLSVAPVVVLPPVDIVARRSVETARIDREEQLERHRVSKAATRPGV